MKWILSRLNDLLSRIIARHAATYYPSTRKKKEDTKSIAPALGILALLKRLHGRRAGKGERRSP